MKFATRAVPWIGVGLLGAGFLASAWLVLGRVNVGRSDKFTTVRFAHWNLQAGIREAYDELIARYEHAHPGLRVEQVPVPVRAWPAWQLTQLVGKTPPDIVQLGRLPNDASVARYFLPLGREIVRPNPYNAGSPIAGQSWKETFFDGLTSTQVYYPSLQDVFGIPTMLMNLRMFYNAQLLREITGSTMPPGNFAEFQVLCQQIKAHTARTGHVLVPIAGSGDYGTYVFQQSLQSQTQRLRPLIDFNHSLLATPRTRAISYLRKEWSLSTPDVLGGLTVFQGLGRAMQPGFLQLKREDAALYFSQQKALMMVTGSWDYYLLSRECPFPIAVGRLPVPDAADPELGKFTVAPPHEGEQQLNGIFGITRSSRHADIALDFLRFLTSHGAATEFSRRTDTLSATIGVDVEDANMRVFSPVRDGPVNGFMLYVTEATLASGEVQRWLQTNAFRLFATDTSPAEFARITEPAYEQAVRRDLQRSASDLMQTNRRSDSALVATLYSAPHDTDRWEQLATANLIRDLEAAQAATVLEK